MSLFDNPEYQWRETYFVLFDKRRRPTLAQVEDALRHAGDRFQLERMSANDEGLFESVTLLALDDYAALDISYMEGPDVREETENLTEELKPMITDPAERAKLASLKDFDARFDIMHFEQVVFDDEEGMEDCFDPSALLLCMEALQKLTGGVGVDPQSGTLM